MGSTGIGAVILRDVRVAPAVVVVVGVVGSVVVSIENRNDDG